MRAAAVILLALVAVITASAATRAISVSKPLTADPRDAGGSLDLRGARAVVGSRTCRMTISTWSSWSSSILGGSNYVPGKNKLALLFDLNGDGKADLTGYVISEKRYVYLFIRTRTDVFAPAAVVRLSPSSVTFNACQFVSELATYPKSLRVAFASTDGTHHDRMPNHGWVRLHNPLIG